MEIIDTAIWSGTALSATPLKIPALAQPGDYLLAFHAPRLSTSQAPTTPSGWTQHLIQAFGNSRFVVYGKEMVAGETDASVVLNTICTTAVSGTVAIRRAKNTAPVDASVSNTSAVTSSATSPTVTTTVAKAMVFRAIWTVNSATSNPPIATWTGKTKLLESTFGTSGNSIALSVVVDTQAAAGAAGTAAITISPNSTSGVWATVAIAPLG